MYNAVVENVEWWSSLVTRGKKLHYIGAVPVRRDCLPTISTLNMSDRSSIIIFFLFEQFRLTSANCLTERETE